MKHTMLSIFLSVVAGAALTVTDAAQPTLPPIDAKYVSAPVQPTGCGLRGKVEQARSKTMVCDDSGVWVEIKATPSAQHSLALALNAPGCVARDPNGAPLKFDSTRNTVVKIARGSTFTAACFVAR